MLLLDEIEKAHPDLFNILLQVMDYGKLTDHNGKNVDFRNVILIMTTNAGASELAKPAIGFGSGIRDGRRPGGDQPHVHAGVPQPARRGRSRSRRCRRRRSAASSTSSSCSSRSSSPTATSRSSSTTSARDWLAEKGYDPLFGARPLARVIQEHIKKPLAEELLFGQLAKGGIVTVSVDEEADKLAFAFRQRPATTPDEPQEDEPKEEELVE